jgi:hypothetical protein
MTPAQYGTLLTQSLGEVDDPRVQAALAYQLGLIEDGLLKTVGAGVTRPSGASTVIGVRVMPATGDLRSSVDASLQAEFENGIPVKDVVVVPVELPIGPAYCATFESDIDIGVPSRTTIYFAQLPSGDIVSVLGTAPTGDTDFPAVVKSVALSLAAG